MFYVLLGLVASWAAAVTPARVSVRGTVVEGHVDGDRLEFVWAGRPASLTLSPPLANALKDGDRSVELDLEIRSVTGYKFGFNELRVQAARASGRALDTREEKWKTFERQFRASRVETKRAASVTLRQQDKPRQSLRGELVIETDRAGRPQARLTFPGGQMAWSGAAAEQFRTALLATPGDAEFHVNRMLELHYRAPGTYRFDVDTAEGLPAKVAWLRTGWFRRACATVMRALD